jgi:ubiquinone/menaquinone biosynthesis C-methylase UbiE
MKGTAASDQQGSDGSPMDHRDRANHPAHQGRQHRREHGGNEFEGVFGLLAGLTMAFGRGRSARLVADEAGVGPGDRVVDVGSGPGRFLREAGERGAEAVGVEPSGQMRRIAAWRTPASLRDRVRVVDGTAERLPLDDGSATVAWAVASVHHWADPDAGLAELHRVLAPGGRLLLAERLARPGGWLQHHALSREGGERLAAQAERAGFADVTVAEGAPGRRRLLLVKARRP